MVTADKDQVQAEYGFVFVHIPKTAGRSILSALGIKFHCQHLRMVDYEEKLGAAELAKRFKFAVVRNPWDRAVSVYHFFHFKQHRRHGGEFVEWVKKFAVKNRTLDQLGYLRTKDGKIACDLILRFENLDAESAELKAKISIFQDHLPNIGKNREGFTGERLPYRHYYKEDAEAIEAIRASNRELIDRFGYTY